MQPTRTLTQPLAIQSWSFRGFESLTTMLAMLKEAGVSAVELSKFHANFEDPASAVETVRQCNEAGVQIVGIGVPLMTGAPEKDRTFFKWCQAAGVKAMSVLFETSAMEDNFRGFKNVEELADEYDVNVGIHNHGAHDWLGTASMQRYVFNNTGPRIGLYMDTAWMIDSRQDYIRIAEKFRDRLFGIHLKDFAFDRSRKAIDVVLGTGNLNLPGMIEALKKIQYPGPLVIEYEGDVNDPVPALRAGIAAITPLL